jgi:hypothetical protein
VRAVVERWAPWLAAAVLVAGIVAYASTRHDHAPSSAAAVHQATPLTPGERRVAYAFIDTAVARKHLARAWSIVAPELKQGMTLDEWKTGTIPVVPYPAGEAKVLLKTVNSFTDTAQLSVTFLPVSGSKVRAAGFTLGLRNVDGHWLASSWQPASSIAPHKGT